uniref:Guided entry of tail-anchored proteins factor 1 n=1 Tax=Ascaris lumbricoides TaxID=6252 RepID=A0A0M3HNA3_ASCLU
MEALKRKAKKRTMTMRLFNTQYKKFKVQMDLLKLRNALASNFGKEIETPTEEAKIEIQHIVKAFYYWKAVIFAISIIATPMISTFIALKSLLS